MSPAKGLSIGALHTLALLCLVVASPAMAASYDDTRRLLGFAPDAIERSPRLLGMGRLTLVGSDENNRLTLWDYARNPVGIIEDDTLSILEFRPATGSVSSVHDRRAGEVSIERQVLASRATRIGYEAWHHTADRSAFGVIGDIGLLRLDEPYNENVERRTSFHVPSAMPVVAGHLPFIGSERFHYALRLVAAQESSTDQYRAIVRNGAGEYIDQDGDIGDPPDSFTPDEYTVRTLGGGGGIGFAMGPAFSIAAGYDRVGLRIRGNNVGDRYDSETDETRPYDVAQVSAVGRVGRLEWAADGRAWKADSKQLWVFSLSSGPAGTPLTGRGKLLDREERGSALRTRARWMAGSLELGAAFDYGRNKVESVAATDPTSFNTFLSSIYNRPQIGDTLVLPDSISSGTAEERDWEASGGLAWSTPWRGAVFGAEYHVREEELEQLTSGIGPRRTSWDVRGGLEVPLGQVLAVRGGYVHRREDRDDLTVRNEYVVNGLTLGAGLTPGQARWNVQAGYSIEWSAADFGDPGRPRGSRQQAAMQVHWSF